MTKERQEEVIRSLDFTLTVSLGEALARETVAKSMNGVTVERLSDKCPKGQVVINLAAETVEALYEYNKIVIPILVERRIWHHDTFNGHKKNKRHGKI